MRLFYTDHFVLPLPDGHRFPMEKYYRLREHLKRTDWAQRCQFQVPIAATDEQLQLAHSKEYIDKVISGTLEPIDVQREIASYYGQTEKLVFKKNAFYLRFMWIHVNRFFV